MVMMGGHYAYLAVRMIRGQKRLILGKLAYDSEDGMREKAEQLWYCRRDRKKFI